MPGFDISLNLHDNLIKQDYRANMEKLIEQLKKQVKQLVTENELRHLIGGSDARRRNQIHRLIKKGVLIKLKRELYCLGPEHRAHLLHPFHIAQFIYGPSYISLESALSFHQLIPEAVKVITCVSPKRNKSFNTVEGVFNYHKTPLANLYCQVKHYHNEDYQFLMAKPFKALCDYIYCYKKDYKLLSELQNDMRLDLDELPILSSNERQELIEYYNSKRIKEFIKLFKKDK